MKFRNLLFTMLTVLLIAMFVNVKSSANIKSLPKSYQGNWTSKQQYIGFSKHNNNNIAVPRINLKIHKNKGTWQYVGALAKDMPGTILDDHKKHFITFTKNTHDKFFKSSYYINGIDPNGTKHHNDKLFSIYKDGKHIWFGYTHAGNEFYRVHHNKK